MITRLDACPACPPGIPDPAPSLAVTGPLSDHQCSQCGSAWTAVWRDGWVIDRLQATVGASGWPSHREAA